MAEGVAVAFFEVEFFECFFIDAGDGVDHRIAETGDGEELVWGGVHGRDCGGRLRFLQEGKNGGFWRVKKCKAPLCHKARFCVFLGAFWGYLT